MAYYRTPYVVTWYLCLQNVLANLWSPALTSMVHAIFMKLNPSLPGYKVKMPKCLKIALCAHFDPLHNYSLLPFSSSLPLLLPVFKRGEVAYLCTSCANRLHSLIGERHAVIPLALKEVCGTNRVNFQVVCHHIGAYSTRIEWWPPVVPEGATTSFQYILI